MLDINRIVANPEDLIDSLKKRGIVSAHIEEKIKSVNEIQKKLKWEAEELRAERNRVSKEVGVLKSQGKDIY